MSITPVLRSGWRRVLAALHPDVSQGLRERLCEVYRAQAQQVAQLTQHAQRMYYPFFCKNLLRIAGEAQAQMPWLREQILAVGGTLPLSAGTPTRGRNSWQCLHSDLDVVQRDRVRLLAGIQLAAREQPAIAAGLRRMREEKRKHGEEIRDMLMKSDPYTVPTPTLLLQDQGERHKRAWLEQYKGKWLEHGRAEWEAGAKQSPWAEWVGEQECKWATELPHRELEWERRLSAQAAVDTSSASVAAQCRMARKERRGYG